MSEMPRNRIQQRGVLGLSAIIGLAGAAGAVSATATESSFGAASARADFKIAYTHSSRAYWTDTDVYVMNADGSERRNLSRAPGPDRAHVWSPDGRKIAFLSRRDGKQEIYTVNADGSGLRNLTRSPEHDFAPAWSPDGRKIVFTRSRDYYQRANVELYVMNADGSGQRRLTHTRGGLDGNPVWSGGAAWSPDGRMLAFTTKRDGSWEVYVMNADGSGQRSLTRNPARDFFYTWLPDGRIVFFSDRDGAPYRYVFVMNADGSGLRNLTREWGLNIWGPVWSPSGGKVAFELGLSLYVMNADGSGRRKLADGVRDIRPAWSPDGRRIAFTKSLGAWERGSIEI
jgi:TolB protein